jgi:hypothetical protein
MIHTTTQNADQIRSGHVISLVWSIKNNRQRARRSRHDDDDGHDPTQVDPGDSSPVGGADVTRAQAGSHSGSGDAHRGGDRDSVLRS